MKESGSDPLKSPLEKGDDMGWSGLTTTERSKPIEGVEPYH
jgi:hypothetical protein